MADPAHGRAHARGLYDRVRDLERQNAALRVRAECAAICEQEGVPHTRASENADVYAEYERVCRNCAAAIRAKP